MGVKHRFNMKSLIVYLALLSLTAAQRPRPPITVGQCPVTGANNPDFDLELYLGDWYTYASNYSPEGITCQRAQYGDTILPDGTISVQNTVTYADGSFDEICGCGTKSATPGELCITFEPGSVNGCADAGADCFENPPYWVLDTDYESYTVTYNCVQILELREETAFILTRDPNPAPEVIDVALDVLAKNNITVDLRFV